MSLFQRFLADRSGATAMVVSLAMLPLLAGFAIAVNYSTAISARSQYQAIADAAALAGATGSTMDGDEARKKRAKEWFDTQVKLRELPAPQVSVSVKDDVVEVTADATYVPVVPLMMYADQVISVRSTAMVTKETIRRVLDVAFCIDATGSMQNTINSVKARAQSFADDLNTALNARGFDKFDYTRIRAVFYRDFNADRGQRFYIQNYGWYQQPQPIAKSDFFEMPGQKTNLDAFIGSETAKGGGDEPESGYECINEAMASKWFAKGATIPHTTYKADEIYPVIVLWSDANALAIPHAPSQSAPLYPADMPRNQTAYLNKWNNAAVIDQKNRLLVQFGLCNNASWQLGRSMIGYMCGGTLSDGNTNMINKIADVMAIRYRGTLTRLTK